MSTVDLFTYAGHDVRTLTIDGEPWFVAADVCRILDIGNARMAVARLDEDGVSSADVIDSMGRTQRASVVNEPGLYELVFLSRKPEAKAFKRWITHDVLPTIRKTGRYGSDVDMLANLPASQMLALAAEAAKRAEEAEAQLEQARPKVIFADAVAASEQSILVAQLANILKQNGVDIGQNRLFERLRADGYLVKSTAPGQRNRPTQRAMDLGLFEVVERTVHGSDGRPILKFTTRVTGKGQQYFIDRYTQKEPAA